MSNARFHRCRNGLLPKAWGRVGERPSILSRGYARKIFEDGVVIVSDGSRVLAAIVYGATSRDPLVLAGVVAAMALLGVLATWIPAQRALSVNPMTLLREE